MQVINELNRPYPINSIQDPLALKHCWIFDCSQLDFMLSEISYLEEAIGSTVVLKIGDEELVVPATWNLVVVDKETYTIDSVPVTALSAFEYDAFIFSPTDSKLISKPASVINWSPEEIACYPAVSKSQAIICAAGYGFKHGEQTIHGVILSPHDLGRHISGRTVGEILNT